MKYLFIFLAIAFVHTSAIAHNPLTAKFELDDTPKEGAILNVFLSQTGLHQALTKHYLQTDFSTIAVNDYKKLAVQYLQKSILINAGDALLKIGEGGIKLGSHQTDIKFLIEKYPVNPQNLYVKINAFQENKNHHSVFWWKSKQHKIKAVLSSSNDYSAVLDPLNNSSITSSFSLGSFSSWYALIAAGLLFILIAVIIQKAMANTMRSFTT